MYKFFTKPDGTHWLNVGEKTYPLNNRDEVGELIYKVLLNEWGLSESDSKEIHKKLAKRLKEI